MYVHVVRSLSSQQNRLDKLLIWCNAGLLSSLNHSTSPYRWKHDESILKLSVSLSRQFLNLLLLFLSLSSRRVEKGQWDRESKIWQLRQVSVWLQKEQCLFGVSFSLHKNSLPMQKKGLLRTRTHKTSQHSNQLREEHTMGLCQD